ncbi:MAG TPA: hypothetical protein VJ778_08450 [Burkholderiales bacterium]|nr:hypothetical protein [Burkholderiales bacterium]
MLPMLRTAIHIVALALVVLAVPLQGMASVAAGQCMALGHHQDAGEQGPAHGSDDGHDHDARSQAYGGKPDGESGTNAHCGPCTACCASASIASPTLASVVRAPTVTQYAFSQFPLVGVEPDGVYRPPLPL